MSGPGSSSQGHSGSSGLSGPAYEGHLQHALRDSNGSLFKRTWELVDYAPKTAANCGVVFPSGPLPLVRSVPTTNTEAVGEASLGVYQQYQVKRTRAGDTWSRRHEARTVAAFKKWSAIISLSPLSFDLGRRHSRDHPLGEELQVSLPNVFAGRSAETLHNRANPLLRFIAWHRAKGTAAFPIHEEAVYEFCKEYQVRGAPTFLKSFLSSLNFSVHVLGLSEAADASNSARVVGIARAAYLTKKKTVRRPPLTAKMVAALERLVCDSQASAIDRVCAGFFLICVFMRARYSDGLNMRCISVDRVPGTKLEGYLEAGVERSKTSFTAERKTDTLPMVCPLRGITDLDWYDQWDQVRHASGVPSGPGIPLLPARAVSGWALYPPKAGQAAGWLRGILSSLGFEPVSVRRVGTHSCKATTLSWCSKYGVCKGTRRTLGYHTAPGDRMVDLYARDSVAPAVRELNCVLESIRSGSFDPDCTRSGYFARQSSDSEAQFQRDAEGSDLSASSENSEDEEDNASDLGDEEAAANQLLDPWAEADLSEEALNRPCARHRNSRILHQVRDESGSQLKCGKQLSTNYEVLSDRPSFMFPLCRRCYP